MRGGEYSQVEITAKNQAAFVRTEGERESQVEPTAARRADV
jgi:hypothetical protein